MLAVRTLQPISCASPHGKGAIFGEPSAPSGPMAESVEPSGEEPLLFQDVFEKGKPLVGWTSQDFNYVSNWYNAKVGLLVQDGRKEGNDGAATVLLPIETMNRALADLCIDAQIRQLGDVRDTAVGVVFGYRDGRNYLRYEERKSYRVAQDRFRRLVEVRDGKEAELASDLYESDYIPTHIYFRIMEDIRIEALSKRVRVWHDNVLLWDLTVPGMAAGAAGFYCRGRGIFAFKSFSIRPISQITESFFQKGPYLQNPTADSMLVAWETSTLGDSNVEYGLDEKLGLHHVDARRTAIHRVLLQGLRPDALYFYRVGSNGVWSDVHSFRTCPVRTRPFSFCVVGDTHSRSITSKIAENIAQDSPDFVVNVGDAATDGRLYSQWSGYFNSMGRLFASVPSYHVLGNHEAGGGNEANLSWFFRYFSHPGFTDHYAFTRGNCRFIVLNNYDSIYEGSHQRDWLLREFRSAQYRKADFRVAFLHEPGYCVGWGLQSYDGNPDVRTILIPMFRENGLDVVFNGHCHDYERARIGDLFIVITGGGGGGHDSKVYDVDCFESYSSEFHHVRVDVRRELMTITATSIEGSIIDRFDVKSRRQKRARPIR